MTGHRWPVQNLALLAFLYPTVPVTAQTGRSIQEIKAPEVFAHVGNFRAGSDEGAIGNTPSIGGAVTVPFARRFSADLDFQTSELSQTRTAPYYLEAYETRRRLIVPSLLYRFGRDSVYGFVGGGIGAELRDELYRSEFRPELGLPGLPPPTPTGVRESRRSDVRRLTSFRGGVVAVMLRHLAVRGDVYMAGWHLGARVGVGYRF